MNSLFCPCVVVTRACSSNHIQLLMNSNLSARGPLSPIIFDFAQFLIDSGKVEDVSAYGLIISRLGFKNDKFLEEMRSFWTLAATSKKPFILDKVN